MGLCLSKPHKSTFTHSSSLHGASEGDHMTNSLFNPDSDPRIDRLIELIEQLCPESATLRQTLNKITQQGGASIYIVPDNEIRNSYGHAETGVATRSIRIGENAISAIEGHSYRALNTCLIELTNLSRADSFERVHHSYLAGRTSIESAARESERVEYGTIEDMTKYYQEAQQGINNLGYGEPGLWYMSTDPATQHTQPGYRSFDSYFVHARRTGHTDAYRQYFRQIADHVG